MTDKIRFFPGRCYHRLGDLPGGDLKSGNKAQGAMTTVFKTRGVRQIPVSWATWEEAASAPRSLSFHPTRPHEHQANATKGSSDTRG